MTHLVESPTVILGSFDSGFLSLPRCKPWPLQMMTGQALSTEAALALCTINTLDPIPCPMHCRELLVMVMRKHQRYFPVYDSSEQLQPVFVTVANGPIDKDLVRVRLLLAVTAICLLSRVPWQR